MKAKNLLVVLLSITSIHGYSQSKVPGIIVELTKGQKIEYMLVDKPKFIFDGSIITLSTASITVEYTPVVLKKVMLSLVEKVGSGFHDLKEVGGSIKLDGGFVRFCGFTSDEAVRVYDAAGTLITTHHTQADGSLVISISSLPSGISIIKMSNQSIKITKR